MNIQRTVLKPNKVEKNIIFLIESKVILKTIKGRRRGSRDVKGRFKRSASPPPSTNTPTTSVNRYFES